MTDEQVSVSLYPIGVNYHFDSFTFIMIDQWRTTLIIILFDNSSLLLPTHFNIHDDHIKREQLS